MKRRAYLKTMLAGACAIASAAETKSNPIQLHVDLSVDPAKEKEMLDNFRKIFRPAATKQAGYIDAKMLKRIKGDLAARADEVADACYRILAA